MTHSIGRLQYIRRVLRGRRRYIPPLVFALLIPATVLAFDFRTPGRVYGIFDLDVAYGARWRLDDRDYRLVGIANHPRGKNIQMANQDDGDLNYDKNDLVSNMFRATGELTLAWRDFGFYSRALAFYDYENMKQGRARTDLGNDAEDQVGKDARILDAYLSTQFDAGNIPVQFRLGKQVISWGESTFFSATGVNAINAFDASLGMHPTTSLKDLPRPTGALWGRADLTTIFSIEGYYQYEWKKTILPALGTYFSANDVIVSGAFNDQFTGSGSRDLGGDQGTDRCIGFGLPPAAYDDQCFDFAFFKSPRSKSENPSDQGQFGFTVQAIVPHWNDTKVALHFANYHEKLGVGSGISASQEVLDQMTEENQAERTAELIPFYLREGLDPAEAESKAASTASAEAKSVQFNGTRLFWQYPEDIKMFGFSFNTTLEKSGIALSGEIAHHRDAPLLMQPSEILGDVFKMSPDADVAPDTTTKSWIRRDRTQTTLGLTQLLGPRLGATQVVLSGEAAWLHIHNFPDDILFFGPGRSGSETKPRTAFADQDSWGYRLIGSMSYTNVFGGLTLRPRVIWSHDVHGVSPLGGAFRERRKAVTVGLSAEYVKTLRFDLAYKTFWGAGQFNLLNDRDYLDFSIRYSL